MPNKKKTSSVSAAPDAETEAAKAEDAPVETSSASTPAKATPKTKASAKPKMEFSTETIG